MKKEVFALLMLFSLLSIASAEIIVTQPNSLYSVGDDFNVTIAISQNQDVNDFLQASLICPEKEVELLKSPVAVKADIQKNIPLEITLDKSLIGNSIGECAIRASYLDEQQSSQKFEISNRIDVTSQINNSVLLPGETTSISGTAKKANGQELEGFAEASIEEIEFSSSSTVDSGKFEFEITLPDNTPASTYNLRIRAYEKNLNEITNEGATTSTIRIKQVVRKIDLAFDSQSISPGNQLAYVPLLYDQSGNEVNQDVGITIYDPNDTIIEKKLVKTGTTEVLETQQNFAPGYWKIDAKLNDLRVEKTFYIEELQKATFELVNQTLVIHNVGNVPYTKPLEVGIGDVNEIKDLSLEVGETKILELMAPDGEYDIQINNGEENRVLGRAALTGNAISVKEMKDFAGKNYPIGMWIILILVLVYLVYKYYKKTRNHNYYGFTPKVSLPIKINPKQENKPIKLDLSSPPASSLAENRPQITPKAGISLINTKSNNIVDNGEKQEVAIIALKIKNSSEVSDPESNAADAIEKALFIAKNVRAKVYASQDYKICIFSPSITKHPENFLLAVKIAKQISDSLIAHNKKFAHKIDFGIAVTKGLMIVESKAGEFKFTSVGNVTILAKNAAERSNQELLITEDLQRRVMANVKGDKIPGTNLWKVNNIVDRSEHSNFISGFMQRQKSNF
jgi:hypothetical protein